MSGAIAHIAHSLSGRTRVKVPARRGDAEYFASTGQQLSECPGVSRVEINALTGSLLIRHTVPFSQVASFANGHNLFTLNAQNEAHNSISHRASANIAWVDEQLAGLSEGSMDLRSVLVIGLLVLSGVQIYRGQILIPAGALLWNVLQLLYWEELKAKSPRTGE